MDELIAQLEAYINDARAQLGIDAAQTSYWRGMIFGLELALLEARKRPEGLPADFYETVNKLIFERLGNLIDQCQARVQRDLLVYNARLTRYELLQDIRQASLGRSPSDYEYRATPDLPNA